jgi:hypothetical protein
LRITSALIAVLTAVALAACGDSKSEKSDKSATPSGGAKPATLALSISEAGKSAKFTAPASAKGGLVEVTLNNKGKKPHTGQLIRLTGGHTPADAVKTIGSNSNKIPAWIRGEGGPSAVAPGKTGRATVILPAGNYLLVDEGGPGSSGPPAYTGLKVTAGASGSLPSAPTTVTAASTGKDKWKWDVSGTLKAGDNRLTFVSKGKDTLHLLGAFRVNGNPSLAKIQKALGSPGKPPAFVDPSTFTTTTILDDGKSEVTSLAIRKPGQYVLFCPLNDRDGGKSHDQEGLLQKITVK